MRSYTTKGRVGRDGKRVGAGLERVELSVTLPRELAEALKEHCTQHELRTCDVVADLIARHLGRTRTSEILSVVRGRYAEAE